MFEIYVRARSLARSLVLRFIETLLLAVLCCV